MKRYHNNHPSTLVLDSIVLQRRKKNLICYRAGQACYFKIFSKVMGKIRFYKRDLLILEICIKDMRKIKVFKNRSFHTIII